MSVKGYKFSVTRWTYFGDLMYSIVTRVNNNAYLKFAMRVELRDSYYNQVKAYTVHHMTKISWVSKSWSKERDFIWKASKLRRWQTRVLKNHLEKVENSVFFYVRGRGERVVFKIGRWLMTEDIWTSGRIHVRQWNFIAFGQQSPVAVGSVMRFL